MSSYTWIALTQLHGIRNGYSVRSVDVLTVQDRVKELDCSIIGARSLGPALFEELRTAQRELGLTHGDRTTCPFLRPHILPRQQYETIKRRDACRRF